VKGVLVGLHNCYVQFTLVLETIRLYFYAACRRDLSKRVMGVGLPKGSYPGMFRAAAALTQLGRFGILTKRRPGWWLAREPAE